MALLRIVGASPKIFLVYCYLIINYSLFSIIIAILLKQLLSLIFFPILDKNFGIYLEKQFLSVKDIYFLTLVLFSSIIASIFPAFQAYKNSVNDGI